MNNNPAQWRISFPFPSATTHKYVRGHAVILGGSSMTGAARLASQAAMRIGAGVCTIVADPASGVIYRNGAPHVLYEPLTGDFSGHYADPRRNALLLGPGFGREDDEILRKAVLGALASGRAAVLDADALNVFAGQPEPLLAALHDGCVLTPHAGEFECLFGDQAAESAAKASGAVVVLKGAETTIAAPDGRVVVNNHATAYLATAGSGDVLAGIILGLLAQGMPAFDAACAGVWIHGEAGLRFGPGLTAPDLIEQIPGILRELT